MTLSPSQLTALQRATADIRTNFPKIMTDYKTHAPNSFDIPEECQSLIKQWQCSLPPHDGVGWTARYSFCFSDNGIVDIITVKDSISGKQFQWSPPIEDW